MAKVIDLERDKSGVYVPRKISLVPKVVGGVVATAAIGGIVWWAVRRQASAAGSGVGGSPGGAWPQGQTSPQPPNGGGTSPPPSSGGSGAPSPAMPTSPPPAGWQNARPLPTATDVPGFDLERNWGKTPTDLRPLFALMERVSGIDGSARIFATIAKRESGFSATAHNDSAEERDGSRRGYANSKDRNPPLVYGAQAAEFGSGGLFGGLGPYFLWTGVPEVGAKAPLLGSPPEIMFLPRVAAFFTTRAAAERAGYRACLRCRPELAPGHALIDAPGRLVARALAAIEAGALQEASVETLAASLGVSGRHLRRAMERTLGVGPLEAATSRRIALAKQLIQDTSLSLAEIAFAAGFGSVRRFNAAFAERFGRAPGTLRRSAPADARLTLRLDYRPPLDWQGLLTFLGARAIPGVEALRGDTYSRIVCLEGHVYAIHARPEPGSSALRVDVEGRPGGGVMALVAALRRLFDLDASPQAIAADLAGDPALGPRVRARPGLRVPGAIDPFELTVRALLGQQVSVRAATTLASRLVDRFGAPAPGLDPASGLVRVFPRATALAAADPPTIAAIGLPEGRARAIHALAVAVAEGSLVLDPVAADREEISARLAALPGFGPWTVGYVRMRALADPDVFLPGDLALRRALGGVTPTRARARGEALRPWRSYALLHLWTAPLLAGEAAPHPALADRGS